MRIRIGSVLPILSVLCAPVLLHAQQRGPAVLDESAAAALVAPSISQPVSVLAQQEQQQEVRPEEEMSTSGLFLGIIGMLGGAAFGSSLGQADCPSRDVDKDCVSRHASIGALIAGTASIPLGVHLANKRRKNLPLSLAISAATGAALYYGMKAIPGEPIGMAPFVAAPLQVITSVRAERSK
jgi:hypothetical protein